MFQMKVVEKFKTHILCMQKKKKNPKILPFVRKRAKIWYSVRSHKLQYNTVQKICDVHGG